MNKNATDSLTRAKNRPEQKNEKILRLLIADDEINICYGLREKVDWHSLGIEVVGCAEDGAEALAIYERETPDIIIADINMPQMDGLELLKKVRDMNANVIVIFISAYSEFAYAQEALKNGAFDYVVKPICEDELAAIVLRAVELIQKRKSQKEMIDKASILQKQEQEKTLLDLLHGFASAEAQIWEAVKAVEPFCADFRFCIGMLIDYSMDGEQPTFLNECLEKKNDDGVLTLPFAQHESGIFVLLFYDDQMLLQNKLRGLYYRIKRKLLENKAEKNIFIGISSETRPRDIAPRLYLECVLAAIGAYHDGKPAVLSDYGEFKKRAGTENVDMEFFADSILCAVSEADYGGVGQCFEKLFYFLGFSKRPASMFDFNLSFYSYITYFLKSLSRYLFVNLSKEALEEVEQFKELSLKKKSLYIYEDCLKKTLRLCSALENGKIHIKSQIVLQAVSYIHKNYRSDISLTGVAKYLNISPTHLSHLFKAELDKTFSSYLTHYRVQKAKKMLKAGDKKIYEIAEEAGFSDPQYFAKIFKKVEGVTPTEYAASAYRTEEPHIT